MKAQKIIACILCLSLAFGLVGGISVNATSACNVSSMLAVYNTQNETVSCTVNYTGSFLPNQNYVFILNAANGSQISLRTVSGTQLSVANNSFSYSFSVDTSLVTSAAKPLTVTVRGMQSYVISAYTVDVTIIDKNPTVSFMDKDGNIIESQTVPYGTAATAPTAPFVEGFEFVAWDKDFSSVTADITVKATYKELKNTLAVVGGTGSGTYSYGEVVNISFTVEGGVYKFDGWTVEGNAVIEDPTAQSTAVTVYGEAIVTANYTEIFEVSIAGGHIAADDVKEYYKAGDEITLIADVPIGKEFVCWDVIAGGTLVDTSASTATLTVNGNVIISAVYTDIKCTLTVVNGEGSGTYNYGDVVDISFHVEGDSYRFDGWTVEGNAVIAAPTAQSTTVTLYGDATVSGSFTQLYKVDVINGTVHTDDIQAYYSPGTVIRIVADAPQAGMIFSAWAVLEGLGEIGDASALSTTVVVGSMDMVVRAEYEEIPNESSSEELSSEDSSEEIIYACNVSSMTVYYNRVAQTITYKAEYTGTFLANQAYMFVLSDDNGGVISAPTVMGTNITVDSNTISYSYSLAGSAIDGLDNVIGAVKSGVPMIISPYTAFLEYVVGDVNGDGFTDNLDAAYVLRYDAEIIDLDTDCFAAADVNGDGEADSLDASQILKHDAGLIELF